MHFPTTTKRVCFFFFTYQDEKPKLLSHWLGFFSTEVFIGGKLSTQAELLHGNSPVIYT